MKCAATLSALADGGDVYLYAAGVNGDAALSGDGDELLETGLIGVWLMMRRNRAGLVPANLLGD